jgi:deoxyribonuclease V
MDLFLYTYDLVRQIPKGMVSSYGAVAEALGDLVASRAVGHMMNQNPDADTMPCFKIVHSDGRVGGFGRGVEDKIRRLNEENIQVENGKIVDFERVLFTEFETDYPLRHLRKEQRRIARKVQIVDDFETLETIAGCDVAYPASEFEPACAVCVLFEYATHQIIKEKVLFEKTDFPYISTYLTYRELPFITKLIESLDCTPSLIMVDGNGILHPYRCGLASHAGVLMDVPTIGVAKRLLYGKVNGTVVSINNEVRGFAEVFSKRAFRPIYISPGHRVSLETSKNIVQDMSTFKIPEPIRQAHIHAKKYLAKNR